MRGNLVEYETNPIKVGRIGWIMIGIGGLFALFFGGRAIKKIITNRTAKKIYENFKSIIDKYSAQFNVPKSIIASVIHQESRGNANARGTSGEYGLMQIMPGTADHIASMMGTTLPDKTKLFIPDTNIKYGAYYLSYLRDRSISAGDPSFTWIAAYNGGWGNRFKEVAGAAKPQQYKRDVLALNETIYKDIFV